MAPKIDGKSIQQDRDSGDFQKLSGIDHYTGSMGGVTPTIMPKSLPTTEALTR
jgi:hypothetical protein